MDKMLRISQQANTESIIKTFGQENAKPSLIPIDPRVHLTKADEAHASDDKAKMKSRPYWSLVGSLMYLSIQPTRPLDHLRARRGVHCGKDCSRSTPAPLLLWGHSNFAMDSANQLDTDQLNFQGAQLKAEVDQLREEVKAAKTEEDDYEVKKLKPSLAKLESYGKAVQNH
ncbi:unnamed protein product [Phytophthora lilii]|uniref:Unnamed protein product n=1 Tax=Phytophthora lilii TaxID=2077276 RepID=A0A9W6X6P2_9STRA|nr:unnamed protein product [Phytophthora lilii]